MPVFYSIAAALSEPNLERALEQTLRIVAQDLRLDAAWIWLLDERSGAFYLAASYDLPPYLREPLHMTGEPCWCMQAFFGGEFVSRNVDVIACSRLQEGIEVLGPGATRGLRSHASVALRFGDRALGLLNAVRAEHPSLAPAELETLETAGAQIGVAVERSRLAERAADAARIEERMSLARELHDTTLQDLAAIALHLESARSKVAAAPVRAQERIETAIALARTALESLRRNVGGLRNDPLQGEMLLSALARLARRFTSETGIQVAVNAPQTLAPLPAGVEFAAYRIASEAFVNARRHAAARRVDLQVDVREGSLVLSVRDDGRGFDASASSDGLGLLGMRERAEAIGGKLRVESGEQNGTSIEATLPFETPR